MPADPDRLNDNGVLDPGETFQFGQAGDKPVVGDWIGNGVTNIGVFRAAADGITGEFILDTNGDHVLDAGNQTFTFGVATAASSSATGTEPARMRSAPTATRPPCRPATRCMRRARPCSRWTLTATTSLERFADGWRTL